MLNAKISEKIKLQKKSRLCPLKNFLNLSVNGLMVMCYEVPDAWDENEKFFENFKFQVHGCSKLECNILLR